MVNTIEAVGDRMPRRWLVEESTNGVVAREAESIDRPGRIGAVSSPLAWRILQELAKAPDYPNALAARMKVHEQKVYYHVRRLEAAGFLKVVREEPRRGASARVLAPSADVFAIVLRGRSAPVPFPAAAHAGPVSRFLEEFSVDGAFDGSIVVGSPYPHGPFVTTARDSPYAVELGFFLGQLFAAPKGLVTRLDTEVKAAGPGKGNMILVGGPVANIITMDLNPHLAVNFDWKQVWHVESPRTRRTYAEEDVGLVAKVRNPWNPARTIVVLSGLHYQGTLASILGLTRYAEDVLDGYEPGKDFYRVVSGTDRDGDGRIDSVSILE